jgi:hypothetical protein
MSNKRLNAATIAARGGGFSVLIMMFSARRRFLTFLVLALCLGMPPASAAQRQSHGSKKKPTAEVKPPDPSPAPPEPLRPEQLPATAPRLSFENGVLTILAQNSTLGDILRDVHSKTGAEIDVPGSASERVVGQFGPGSPRDVLASLLNGSHFNYVMVGTATDPNSVAQVILTPRTGGETPPSVSESAAAGGQNGMMTVQPPINGQPFPPRSFPQPQTQGQVQGQVVVDTNDDPAPDSAEENQDESAQDQDNGENGDQGAPEQADQGQAGQNPNQPTVKTPEQLLQELQRQQQVMQQQQQQQGQNSTQQQPAQPQAVYPPPQLQQPPQQEK